MLLSGGSSWNGMDDNCLAFRLNDLRLMKTVEIRFLYINSYYRHTNVATFPEDDIELSILLAVAATLT